MRLVHRNPVVIAVVAAVVRVADEDFLAGAEAVDATNHLAFGRRNLSAWEQDLSVKVVAAINGMKRSGYDAHLYKHQGQGWVEIERYMLATSDEIEQRVDRINSLDGSDGIFNKRTQKNWTGILIRFDE